MFGICAVAAVKEGDLCGPASSNSTRARWISIPASSIFATGDAGATNATDACVTSDMGFAANAHVNLPDGTWTVYSITARIKANEPVPANSTLKLLVGDAGESQIGNSCSNLMSQSAAAPCLCCCCWVYCCS
jgi:hypothetical protein